MRCADHVDESGNVIMQTHHLSAVPCQEPLGWASASSQVNPQFDGRVSWAWKARLPALILFPLPLQHGFLTPSPQTNGKLRFYVVVRTISDNCRGRGVGINQNSTSQCLSRQLRLPLSPSRCHWWLPPRWTSTLHVFPTWRGTQMSCPWPSSSCGEGVLPRRSSHMLRAPNARG